MKENCRLFHTCIMGIVYLLMVASCVNIGLVRNESYDLAIQNVQVFNSQTKTVKVNQTVLINRDTIAAIVDATKRINATKIIRGNGKLLTPGFVDTHIHLQQMLRLDRGNGPDKIDDSFRKRLSEKCLPWGTTTAIDMGQPESWLPVTTKWQENPSPDFPNYYVLGGALISERGGRGVPQHHIEVRVEDASNKIRYYKDLNIKNIKLYWRLNEPEMKAIIAAANKEDMEMYAHVDHNIITIPQAMDLGVRNFEHFFTLTPSILKYDEHWDRMNAKYNIPESDGHIDDFSIAMTYFFKYIKETPEVEAKLFDLMDRFVAEGATISTAAHVLGAAAGLTDFFSSFSHFPVREKVRHDGFNEQHKKEMKEAFEQMMTYMKIAYDKGVGIRIGTDNREAGRAMISEMLLMARAKFSVEDILQIATWNGATGMNLQDRIGSIEVGKQADLVLFEQNPFDDFNNFASSKTVIKGGKLYVHSQSTADAILEIAKKQDINEMENRITNIDSINLHPFDLVQAGYVLLQSDNIDKAFSLFSFSKELFPEYQPVYYENIFNNVGYDLLSKGDIQNALILFEANKINFPNSANVYDSAAEAYMLDGQTSKAIKDYQQSVSINPENIGALKQLKKLNGDNYEATRNKPSLAEELLSRFKKDGVDAAKDWFDTTSKTMEYRLFEDEMTERAYDALGEGLIVEALEMLKLNVQSFPKSTFVFDEDVMYSVSKQLMELEMHQEAIDYLELNAQVFLSSTKAFKMLGDANAQAGNKDLAIKNYMKSLEINPENRSAREALENLRN